MMEDVNPVGRFDIVSAGAAAGVTSETVFRMVGLASRLRHAADELDAALSGRQNLALEEARFRLAATEIQLVNLDILRWIAATAPTSDGDPI